MDKKVVVPNKFRTKNKLDDVVFQINNIISRIDNNIINLKDRIDTKCKTIDTKCDTKNDELTKIIELNKGDVLSKRVAELNDEYADALILIETDYESIQKKFNEIEKVTYKYTNLE